MPKKGFRKITIDKVKYEMMTIDGCFQGFHFNDRRDFLFREQIEAAVHLLSLPHSGEGDIKVDVCGKNIPKKTFELLHNFANLKYK